MDFDNIENAKKLLDEEEKKNPKGMSSVKNKINELSKLSDDQLTTEFKKQIAMKKENGTLGDIEKTVRMLSPFLNKEQKERLLNILKNLRDN